MKHANLELCPVRVTFRVLILIVAFVSIEARSDPNVLLGEAIQNANKLTVSLPTKDRLAAYEAIFDSLDRIVEQYPSSDQAIKILSGQQVGAFDPVALRRAYIQDLTGYYDTVCQASPSYSCLGFVSLKIGNRQCASASDLQGIIEAHANLRNAAKVFIGQKDDSSYISLAMNSYRDCLSTSNFSVTTFAVDYFASELLDLLFASDQASFARASIEDMETPYFKFLGALKLSSHEDRPFDRSFFDRMKRYINDRIPPWGGNSQMANYALLLSAIRRSSIPISYQDARSAADYSSRWVNHGESLSCDHVFSRTIFDMLSTLQAELIGLDDDRGGILLGDAFAADLMLWYRDSAAPVLSACKEDGLYDYYLMIDLHGQLVLDDLTAAAEFKHRSLKESLSDREQLEFFFDHFGESEEKLALLGPHDFAATPRIKGDHILDLEYSEYLVFEKRVDFGDVCEASRILFQDLKGREDFYLGIQYMINSPNIDPRITYNCGDEDLELLLQ